jgi:two-component system sensor histidine kinase MtrB
VVAAVSAGIVAVVTIVLAREYRWRALRDDAVSETRLALAIGPDDLATASFDRFLELYQRRSDAHVVAVQDSRTLSSSSDFTIDDIPSNLDEIGEEPTLVETDTNGEPMLVSGAIGSDGVSYYLFFSLRQYRDSLAELIRAAALAWGCTVAIAGGVGWLIARRTLRPVRVVAAAADAIAAGNLQARLDADSDDELGVLSRSFNNMADEVERLIDRLESSAERERRFSADVAHELRTPLTGMSAAAAVLDAQCDALPPSTRKPAEILINDVARLKQLIVELLELATLDANEPPATVASLDLATAVHTVIGDAQQRRHADIRVDVADGIAVRADPFALRRILGNLIDNATVHGGGRISVRGQVDAADQDRIRVEVIDCGPGIAPDELGRIFERFHKTDRSRASGGSGLGLAIARKYARQQGGQLTASNEPEGGARFTLYLARSREGLPEA